MRKTELRSILILLLLLLLPAYAGAWTLTVKVTGGSLTPANTVVLSGGASRTLTGGSTTLYPTAPTTITVNTASGYTSSVTLDGINAPASPFTLSSGSHTVAVTYSLPSTASLTINQGSGGTISVMLPNSTWTTTGATGLAVGTNLPFSIAPQTNQRVSSYTINGTTTTVTGSAVGQPVSGSFNAVAGGNVIAAGYSFIATITPTLSAPTTGYTTQPITCSASAVSNDTGLRYAFQVTGPASFSQAASTNQSFTFIPTLTGTYQVTATVTSDNGGNASTAPASVVVTDYQSYLNSPCVSCHSSRNAAIISQYQGSRHNLNTDSTCMGCHTADTPHSVGINATNIDAATFQVKNGNVVGMSQGSTFCLKCHNQAIVTDFNASRHKAVSLTCSACHRTGVHASDFDPTACASCHLDGNGEVPDHPLPIGTSSCYSCHNPHGLSALSSAPAVHFNNLTGAGYPASYVTSGRVCADCHTAGASNGDNRRQWALSGHADTTSPSWSGSDFKTMTGCVQCHSSTGFLAYSTGKVTSAWGVASDKTKELLICVGCHSDVTNGVLRTLAPLRPYADDPEYLNPESGKSNVCIACHGGVRNGKSIEARLAQQADFGNLPFIDPHYLAAAGNVFANGGYHFPGRDYQSTALHGGIGALDGRGPCISCHKNGSNGHKFLAGAMPVCSDCHGSFLDEARLSGAKSEFLNALEILRAQLAARGFVYSQLPPHFSNSNWGPGQAGANTMGAAFNYALLARDPGAYAHNAGYAAKLVLDSIDYLDNGALDDSVGSIAVPELLGSQAISQAAADSMTGYRTKNGCTICHGGTASTPTPMASNGHPGHLTDLYGPGSYLGSELGSCQNCHLYGTATHMSGAVDLITGPGSACAGCHPGSVPAWNTGVRLECTSCHAPTPSRLPNGSAAPYMGYFVPDGHGRYTGSNQCTSCHDPDSRHISGSLGSYTRLRLLNDNALCASCHDSSAVGADARNMQTHVGLDCRVCHDPHGSANLAMIRSVVGGWNIVFGDRNEQLIDPVTNRGLCQVCHTATAHYRAGVAESDHPTSGCLNCHGHNSAGGGFKPSGGSCDACHGYPPAPRNTGIGFGTENNWVNARFEDYSGGGGAHLAIAHVSPLATASQGWLNCAVCHNGGDTGSAPYHSMTTPVRSHIDNVTVLVDAKLRFAEGFTVYTGAKLFNLPAQNQTGNCFNIACHMSPSPRWSTER